MNLLDRLNADQEAGQEGITVDDLLRYMGAAYLLSNPLQWAHFVGLVSYVLICDLILPNIIAAFYAEWLVTKLFPILKVPYAATSPITLSLIFFAKKGRIHDQEEEEAPEDIKAFLRAGAEEGIIEEKEKPLLHNILNFNDTIVREVMTPRTDMKCVARSMLPQQILDTFSKTNFSRLPVYGENIDQIEGFIRLKDIIKMKPNETEISTYISEIPFVPERKNISDMLQEMLKNRCQMAIVIDEYGGTSGLITLEDLIEEIVGEIHDEHETPESDEIIKLENGSFLLDGKFNLQEFCELFSLEEDEEDIDTVGGYIFNQEGCIPNVGDALQIGDVNVEIVRADERRIYKLIATPPLKST